MKKAHSRTAFQCPQCFCQTTPLWESLGLLQPKVKGPEVKVGDTTVSIEQQTRTKIKAVL